MAWLVAAILPQLFFIAVARSPSWRSLSLTALAVLDVMARVANRRPAPVPWHRPYRSALLCQHVDIKIEDVHLSDHPRLATRGGVADA
eukprot:349954-Chlamydomonas_euryale.AAC.1